MMITIMTLQQTDWKKHLVLLTKGAGIAAIALLITVLAIFLTLSSYLHNKFQAFQAASGYTTPQIEQLVKTILQNARQPLTTPVTILLLGVDSLENRPGSPQLTDTMLLAQVDFQTATITTLPLPRDLWSDAYKTRINALYHYGNEQQREQPESFPTEVISAMTGLIIDHTIVIEMDTLATLIDLLGGITLIVPETFTDEAFPRSDVDVSVERDPAKLYKTVRFEAGEQLLTGERALEYIRSRKSSSDQGTDEARSARQQQVIMGLFKELTDPATFLHPTTAGKLLAFYQQHFDQYLPINRAAHIGVSLYPQLDQLKFQNEQLPITNATTVGVIYHPPPYLYNGQWIYVVESETAVKEYVTELFSPQSEFTK